MEPNPSTSSPISLKSVLTNYQFSLIKMSPLPTFLKKPLLPLLYRRPSTLNVSLSFTNSNWYVSTE